jgi:zinc transport system substrate-binding protein
MVLVFAAVALGLGVAPGCGGAEPSEASARREVAAAFYPLAWSAERVGGSAVDVWNVTPPGAEPHDVELSARDVERIRSADVVLLLGEGFQPAFEEAAGDADGEVVDLLAGVRLERSTSTAHDPAGEEPAEQLDPHVWLDPLRFAAQVRRIGAALGRPAEAARLEGELRALHRHFRRGLAECERREVVTSHAAFGYLADRYGLEQIALTGVSPEAEVSARDIEHVVERVQEHGATTVFFETLVSPRLAETVAREAGARTAVLNPLEGLTDEELERGEDYLSVMRGNLAALRRALACR